MSPPYYCPYCGETDLEPVGDAGGWACGSCGRRFTVRPLRPDPAPPAQP